MEISKGIHDGRTEGLQEIQTRTEALGQTLTVDDFVFQGKALNDRLNRYLRTWKSFPTYRYVINTLKNNMFYHGDDRALELLYEERERGQKLSEASEEALESLCDALIQKVEDLPDKALREKLTAEFPSEKIRDNLLELQEGFFLNFLAPILDLDLYEIDVFLVRVLKRDQLCCYSADEYLLRQAVQIHEQLQGTGTLEILYELKSCYEKLPDAGQVTELPEEEGTVYIAEKSDEKLKGMEETGRAFRVEDYPEIAELLVWYKSLECPLGRDRAEAYEKLFREVYDLYQDETDDYLKVLQVEEVKRTKQKHREALSLPITIWYRKAGEDAEKSEQKIPAGTRFFGKNCIYEINKDVVLPREDYVSVAVHVLPSEENKKQAPPKTKSLPKNVPLEIVAGNFLRNGKPVVRNVHTDVITNIDPSKDSKLWTKPKWTEDPEGKGFVMMEVLAGEKIPEDLCLEYKGFRFVPSDGLDRKYELHTTVTAYLDVTSIDREHVSCEKKRGNYVFEDTNSVTRMEPKADWILRVSNMGNRMIGRMEMFDENLHLVTPPAPDMGELKKQMTPWRLFAEYMYSARDFEIASGLDTELGGKIGLDTEAVACDWIRESMVQGDARWFSGLPQHRQRNVVLALLFLVYIKKNCQAIGLREERFIRNFRGYVERNMGEFRFDGLYLGYPLDCLLMFLLASCDVSDMCDTLRILYKETVKKGGKSSAR